MNTESLRKAFPPTPVPEDALLTPLWGGHESAVSVILVGKTWPEITLTEIRAVYDEIAELGCRTFQAILPALMLGALSEEADFELYATFNIFADGERYARGFFGCFTREQIGETDRFLSMMNERYRDSVGLRTTRALALWRTHLTNVE